MFFKAVKAVNCNMPLQASILPFQAVFRQWPMRYASVYIWGVYAPNMEATRPLPGTAFQGARLNRQIRPQYPGSGGCLRSIFDAEYPERGSRSVP